VLVAVDEIAFVVVLGIALVDLITCASLLVHRWLAHGILLRVLDLLCNFLHKRKHRDDTILLVGHMQPETVGQT
jgi:hypothetical protein